MTDAQLFSYCGDLLFTEIMTDQVHLLTENYRVRYEVFKALLGRIRTGHPTLGNAEKMMKLHVLFYRINSHFEQELEGHKKTMWLFSDDADVKRKNVDRLVHTSKTNNITVARLDYWYESNKLPNGKEQ